MELLSVIGILMFFIIIYDKESGIEKIFSKYPFIEKITPIIVCFIISFLFASGLSLSPFNGNSPGTDSSVFLYIGKAMHQGAVPYKDLFDHKGPLLYLIQYIGYFFGSKIGVWIIELINIFATSFIFYHMCRLFSKSRIACFLSIAIVVLLSSSNFFQGGNFTEEYALPWIAISLYFVMSFFVTNKYRNWHIVLIGFAFAIVFFLRVNMIGIWAGLLLPIIICFIKNKRISELIKSIFLFIIGCLAVTIPVLIYLLKTDSLKEMIDCYFLFNFSYVDVSSKIKMVYLLLQSIQLAGVASFCVIYTFYIGFKNKIIWINLIAMGFAFLSVALSGRVYEHYGIVLIPFFIIPTIFTILPLLNKTKEMSISIKKKSVFIVISILCFLCVALKPVYDYVLSSKVSISPNSITEYLINNTNVNDDVLILENSAVYYIDSNRHTQNKFFYQTPPIKVSSKLCADFIAELKQHPSDYIIWSVKYRSIEERCIPKEVIEYLDSECKNGMYKLEEYADFSIYIRK